MNVFYEIDHRSELDTKNSVQSNTFGLKSVIEFRRILQTVRSCKAHSEIVLNTTIECWMTKFVLIDKTIHFLANESLRIRVPNCGTDSLHVYRKRLIS